MLAVGKHDKGEPIPLAEIARLTGISRAYLDQLTVALKNASILKGHTGHRGGFTLGKPIDAIRIGDVIQAAIGPISIVECVDDPQSCVQSEFCSCMPLWKLINRKILRALNSYSLSDLLEESWHRRIGQDLDGDDLVGDGANAAVFEHVPCAVAVIDRELRIARTNARFEQTFGQGAGERCYAAFKGLEQRCPHCEVVQIFDDGEKRVSEEEGRSISGGPLCYQLHAVPIHANDNVTHVALMALDVTPRRGLERELRQAERLATIGLTTAGLAHSVKSILGGLEGGCYVVDSGLERVDVDRIRMGWEMVRSFIGQVGSLVGNLLRYARPEEIERQQTDANTLVDEAIALFSGKADLVGVELTAHKSAGLEPVEVDRDAIRGCLANLLSNAIDACVWDPADDKKEHRIIVASRPRPGGGVILEISDNGMGIAKENQERVFAAVFTTKGIRGTGLGLLLTRKAVKEHGGSIHFSSEQGRGTSFKIELPAATSTPV